MAVIAALLVTVLDLAPSSRRVLSSSAPRRQICRMARSRMIRQFRALNLVAGGRFAGPV